MSADILIEDETQMKTHFEPFVLEKLKSLFRDEESYQTFKDKLIASLNAGFSPVLAEGRILGLAVSTENGKELIYQRVTEQWAKNPLFLETLRHSVESEDLVEAPELENTSQASLSEHKPTQQC